MPEPTNHNLNEDDRKWRERLRGQVTENNRLFFSIAFNVLRDAELSEDVCQKAFLVAWKKRLQIQNPKKLKSWLSSTVLNESLTMLRRAKIEQRAITEQALGTSETTSTIDHLAEREHALAALSELHEPTRSVVALRVMQDMSGNEVSALLDISPSEVSRRLHHGLESLRKKTKHPE